MNNLMKRIMSVAMAAITTTSPILSSYTIMRKHGMKNLNDAV